MDALGAISKLVILDFLFVCVMILLVVLLARRKQAAYAVLKRNFLGYFSNPTGYVFLCLFVLLTSMAAFWPHAFFVANMATLDQLNIWFPVIMLFFIPAITMSIWADERRQGTDELLLTLPADDFDIVVGKYLASASIYTASLMFSQISTFIVLVFLTEGRVDTGLFFSNYLGYWCIGLAMISIGMVASFLTSNLTVGFILGALFNAPLVFADRSDVITPMRGWGSEIKEYSLTERFDDFGRGMISLSSLAFFLLLAVVGLYLCMVLIGRRHWSGGKDGNSMFLHYVARVVLLIVIAGGASFFFRNNDYPRYDATDGKDVSLSPVTRKMIRSMQPDRTIVVDAFISADIPEQYAKTRKDLISRLKEFESTAMWNKIPIEVHINDNIDVFSDEATRAKEAFGIVPQSVRARERGTLRDQEVILGAAFTSGLEKVIVPFFESGIPVEYELVRSLTTVSRPARKKLGILRTDAQLNGGFSMATMRQSPRQPIVAELDKQYEIIDIDPTSPISRDQIDVLLAVQPSSLGPPEMVNFVDAVKSGIPTAIFEDPRPLAFDMPGTGEPKQAGGGPMAMFGGGSPPQPKGDIRPLWKALGLKIPGGMSATGGINPDICWQQYNPYPMLASLQQASDEWIFVRQELPGIEFPFSNDSEITKGLRELMFLYAGVVLPEEGTDMKIVNLVSTGENAGVVDFQKVQASMRSGGGSEQQSRNFRGSQVVAVYVEGKSANTKPASDSSSTVEKQDTSEVLKPVKAVYVADADCIASVFVDIRNRPEQFEEIEFRMQNITFLLNAIDVLAGELDYPAIRRHEPQHSTLKLVENQAAVALKAEAEKRLEYAAARDAAIQEAEADNAKLLRTFEERVRTLEADVTSPAKRNELTKAVQDVQAKNAVLNRQLGVKKQGLENELKDKIAKAKNASDLEIQRIQNKYKMLAVFLPPIPPLLVGVIVFVSRRLREREGIAKSRLK